MMKTRLLAILAGTAIVAFSTVALAGGKDCDSKKGWHDKEMSAEMKEEFKKHHKWYSEDGYKHEKMAVQKDAAIKI